MANAVVEACDESSDFHYSYEASDSIMEKIEALTTTVYGGAGVDYSAEAKKKIAALEADDHLKNLGVCMVKSHLSLSDNPDLKGRPKGWRLQVHDVKVFQGAGFIVPMAGTIKLMPGTGSNPNFRRIDIDVDTGKVTGLF